MDPKIDRLNSTANNFQSHSVLTEYMDRMELTDVWRNLNPEKCLYTWCRDRGKRNRISASRIDMFLLSSTYSDSIGDSSIVYGHMTDHSLIQTSINLDNFVRGPGSWKLNNSHLYENDYCELMTDTIVETWKNNTHLNPNDRWGELKHVCASKSKEYGRAKKAECNTELNNLYSIHEVLKSNIMRHPACDDAQKSLQQVKSRIELIEMKRIESSAFRSKCNWSEYGEKNSKMFFSLEKTKYAAKNMKTIITDAGQHVTEQQSILSEQMKFFKSLYAQDKKVVFNLHKEAPRNHT